MKIRIRVPKPLGHLLLIGFIMYFGYWTWTHVGSAGELRPTSSTRILFPIWSHAAWDTAGYAWAREGDTIALDYDVALEAGWFSLTVGKRRWFYRRLLRHEQTRSFRGSAAGQLEYRVRETGVYAIWAGRYSVWRGDARVRWTVRRAGGALSFLTRGTSPAATVARAGVALVPGGACAFQPSGPTSVGPEGWLWRRSVTTPTSVATPTLSRTAAVAMVRSGRIPFTSQASECRRRSSRSG